MSEIGKAMFGWLASEGTGTTLYGLIGTRITPEARTQGAALPCAVYSISEDESEIALNGATNFRKAQVEVVAVASTAASAAAVHEAIRTVLQGSKIINSVVINHCLHTKSLTNYQAPIAGEAAGAFLHSALYSVMYQD